MMDKTALGHDGLCSSYLDQVLEFLWLAQLTAVLDSILGLLR